MVKKEVAVARWVAKVDALIRENGFYSEALSDFIYEAGRDDQEIILFLCEYAVEMAAVPDTMWTSDVRTFVDTLEEDLLS